MKGWVGFPTPEKITFIFPKHKLVTIQSHWLYKYTILIFKPATLVGPNVVQ